MNKSDIPVKLVTSCQQVVSNMLTTWNQQAAVGTQLVDSFLTDLLQVARFLCV